jgi:hypothetical protein
VAWLREQLGLPPEAGVTLDDFSAYMPQHFFIFTPTREPWPASNGDRYAAKWSSQAFEKRKLNTNIPSCQPRNFI